MVAGISGSTNPFGTGTTGTSTAGASTAGTATTTATPAASGTSTGTAAAFNAKLQMSDIEEQLKELADQQTANAERSAKQQALAEKQSKIEVMSYEKTVRKSPFNSLSAATDIGQLQRNETRLNVFSAVDPKDSGGDFYRFRNRSAGEVTFGFLTEDSNLRVQVMTRFGGVVADSNEDSGRAYENFTKMQQGDFNLAAGDYVVKVSHLKKPDAKAEESNYAIQVSMGTYKRDYDTIARQPRAGDGLPQLSQSQMELQNMLSASSSFINSLPPIGTPATAKLSQSLVSLFA